MADIYTQLALHIELTPDEAAYLEGLYDKPEDWVEDPADPDIPGFDFKTSGAKQVVGSIVSEDHVNLENLAQFLMCFMRDKRPGQVIGFEYAFTCTKPWNGEFGGGACVIDSKENIEWCSTSRWMHDTMKKLGGNPDG